MGKKHDPKLWFQKRFEKYDFTYLNTLRIFNTKLKDYGDQSEVGFKILNVIPFYFNSHFLNPFFSLTPTRGCGQF